MATKLIRRKKESDTKVLLRRRETDKDRQIRFRERQLAEGKKPVMAYLTPEARTILDREKDRAGESNSEVIERAILNLKPKPQLKRRKAK